MTDNFCYVTSITEHNASLLKLKFLNRIELVHSQMVSRRIWTILPK